MKHFGTVGYFEFLPFMAIFAADSFAACNYWLRPCLGAVQKDCTQSVAPFRLGLVQQARRRLNAFQYLANISFAGFE